MAAEDNKRVARRMTDDAWNLGKPQVLDEICAPSYHLHGTGGIAELKRDMVAARQAFPDLAFTVEEMIAEGDAVARAGRCAVPTAGSSKTLRPPASR